MASDQDWELLSSSGEPEEEAAALAASFLLAEPAAAAAGAEGDGEGADAGSFDSAGEQAEQEKEAQGMNAFPGRGEGGALIASYAPGSPERLQLLAAASSGDDSPLPASGHSGGGGYGSPSAMPAELAAAAAAAAAAAGGGGASPRLPRPAAADPPAKSVRLRVVRSDEQEALERAVTSLEKRALQRERELTMARARLSGAQAALDQECREANRFRRIALIACSVCAFLGMKALLGSPLIGSTTASALVGAGAGAGASAAQRATATAAVARSVQDPTLTSMAALGLLQPVGVASDGRCKGCQLVAVEVEPLSASI